MLQRGGKRERSVAVIEGKVKEGGWERVHVGEGIRSEVGEERRPWTVGLSEEGGDHER